jgi:spore germination protein PD
MPRPINFQVTNGPVCVQTVSVLGVSSSSSFLIGDTESMTLSSYFDTPPESVIFGPLAPLPPLPEEDIEA